MLKTFQIQLLAIGLPKKDILFSNIRTYFKKVWLAEFSGGCSPDVLVMRSKNTDILLNEYLFLLIRSDDFINFTVISANGAKMPRGDKNAMKGFIFNIPSIEYQKNVLLIILPLTKNPTQHPNQPNPRSHCTGNLQKLVCGF
ncbi:hypothetical protein [Mannheimia haemolytica]|uniref:hypothetical protein n=1 Tax=Mannheimia haemolytica TaxID=75985 RepID=UPI0038F7ED0B